jgi:D-cysteine desulfhydrase family pyridoxal phosphate-dependent enzyme
MIPRIHLANLPTPIEAMPRLSAHLGGPSLFIKRDDLTGLAFGGNKTRKLEFLLADAQTKGARTLISAGAIQSNHCRQVAAAAAKFGMGCILVLFGNPPDQVEGNFLLDQLLGAEVAFTMRERRDTQLQICFEEAQAAGRAPYLIPYGGSNAIGALAYADAFEEMLGQGMVPDWVIFASSSGGTQAGLTLGAKKAGFDGKVLGISVDGSAAELQSLVAPLVKAAATLLGDPIQIPPGEILVNADYTGEGYGIMGDAEAEAIQLFARLEGILLDPVYTGRAAAGLIDLVRKGYFEPKERLLFWHTGGTPALFAGQYSQKLYQSGKCP